MVHGRTELAAATAPPLRLALFALAVVGAMAGFGVLVMHATSDPLADVHAYYDAATRLNAGDPLYEQPASADEAAFYRYPPLLAIVFRPLALLPFPVAAAAWELVVVGSLVLLVLRFGPRRESTWLALGILALPIGWSVAIGQAQVPVTLLMALGSPAAIALAAQIKLLPALLALWWIGRHDWAALARFAAWSVGLVLVQLVLEPRGTVDFVGATSLDQVGTAVRNLSPYAASPLLWAVLVAAGALVVTLLAPTRWGWAAAVALAVLASPRLLVYMLMALIAGLRAPNAGGAGRRSRAPGSDVRPRPARGRPTAPGSDGPPTSPAGPR